MSITTMVLHSLSEASFDVAVSWLCAPSSMPLIAEWVTGQQGQVLCRSHFNPTQQVLCSLIRVSFDEEKESEL
jgi:hypothetical protein